MRRRWVGVAAALAIVASATFVVSFQSKRAREREEKMSPEATAEFFSPMGSPFAKVRVEVFTPFEKTCPSCILGAREVFKDILRKYKDKVRFEFIDTGAPQKNWEKIEKLGKSLEEQGVPPNPLAEAWILVNGKVKFNVGGETVILDEFPRPMDTSAKRFMKIIDEEVKRVYGVAEGYISRPSRRNLSPHRRPRT